MDVSRAKQILEVLAEGVNPLTGEILPLNDSCNQGDVVRALQVAIRAMEKEDSSKRPTPKNAGKPWTDSEIQKLLEAFDSGMTIPEIAKVHERSKGAVETRLVMHGRIQETYFTRNLMKK